MEKDKKNGPLAVTERLPWENDRKKAQNSKIQLKIYP